MLNRHLSQECQLYVILLGEAYKQAKCDSIQLERGLTGIGGGSWVDDSSRNIYVVAFKSGQVFHVSPQDNAQMRTTGTSTPKCSAISIPARSTR
jgi:hypothetical protein